MESKYALVLAACVVAVLVSGCVQQAPSGQNQSNTTFVSNTTLVDCTGDMMCLRNHFVSCSPAMLTMQSGDMRAVVTVHGLENERCHYTMDMNGVTGADCYFKQTDLTDKVLNQMFGNEEGQDAIIEEACQMR